MINSEEVGRPLTFVGKYKYSGLNRVSNSSHGKSVRTVYTTVGHSALPVSIFIRCRKPGALFTGLNHRVYDKEICTFSQLCKSLEYGVCVAPSGHVDCLFRGIIVRVCVVRVVILCPAPACWVTPRAGAAPPIMSSSWTSPKSWWDSSPSIAP